MDALILTLGIAAAVLGIVVLIVLSPVLIPVGLLVLWAVK